MAVSIDKVRKILHQLFTPTQQAEMHMLQFFGNGAGAIDQTKVVGRSVKSVTRSAANTVQVQLVYGAGSQGTLVQWNFEIGNSVSQFNIACNWDKANSNVANGLYQFVFGNSSNNGGIDVPAGVLVHMSLTTSQRASGKGA